MKTTNFLFIPLALICLSLSTGCKEEITGAPQEPSEPEPTLTELPGTRELFRRSFDAQAYNDALLIQTENIDLRFEEGDMPALSFSETDRRAADATSTRLRVKVRPSHVEVEPIDGRLFDNGPRFLLFTDTLGPGAVVLPFNLEYPLRAASISEDNIVLLPYRIDNDERLWIALLELDYPENPVFFDVPELTSLKTFPLDVPGSGYSDRGWVMHPVTGGFLLTLNTFDNQNTYRIDYDGSHDYVLGLSPGHFFDFRGELYGARNNNGNLELITADTDGRNWRNTYTIPNQFNDNFRFFPAGDDLYMQGRVSGQFFVLTALGPEGISFAALAADALMSRTVTDVAHYNGNTYVTTLSGTFVQETNSLRESRAE